MSNKGKTNKKAPKSVKPFSIGVTLLLIFILSCTFVAASISMGFLFDALITFIIGEKAAEKLAICFILTAVLVTILLALFFTLIRHRRTEKKYLVTESYANAALIVLVFLAIGAAVTLIALGNNDLDYLLAIVIFPTVGIITTPNAVRYALKDIKKWEKIFYSNGNLHRCKEDENFYKVKAPVSFENKLFWAVFKNQVLDHVVVICLMLLIVNSAIIRILYDSHKAAPGLIGAIVHVRFERAGGFLFFALIFIAAFGIPILVYYITNAVCRLRVVKKHTYIAYHAIVKNVRSYKITINHDGRKYSYKYATCVGIREKNVHDTKAVLVFIPDDVLVFPDKDQL